MSNSTITIHLTSNDVAETRFAYSPMLETVASYKRLLSSKPDARYRLWLDEARRALYGLEFPYINELIRNSFYIPDFLTPTPAATGLTFEDEIEQTLRLPDAIIQNNIRELIGWVGETEMLNQFLAYPKESLWCVTEELRLYWQRTLAHHWPRMESVLEEDILYRARNLALGGYHKLFGDLASGLSYQPGEIRVVKPEEKLPINTVNLEGRGLQLVPAIFTASDVMMQFAPEWQPMLIYGPRGTGLWWRDPAPEANRSLEIALGTGRARVLQALTTPASTGELARRLKLTDGAVSQHLGRLRQAGLVASRRSAKKVYYHLTRRGEQLLLIFNGRYEGKSLTS